VCLSGPRGRVVIVPGFIDCHCHLELSGLAGKIGLRKGQGLLPWLMKLLIYRLKRKTTQARWVRQGAQQCLAGGTTTVADISANNRSWQTLVREPIRKICFAEVLGFGPKAGRAMAGLQERMKDMPDQREGFWKGVSPHAPYSTDESVYRESLALARRHRWRIMTHLAEDPAELELVRHGRGPWRKVLRALRLWDGRFKPTGSGPVAWAREIGLLDEKVLLAHVNYADDQDIGLLARGRATVVYCPLAHEYFHHPAHRYRDMRSAGVNVVLGTDSLACNPSLSMLDQMRAVRRAGGLAAEDVLEMATCRAAESLGLGSLIGTVEHGKLADLAVIAVPRTAEKQVAAAVLDPCSTVAAVMIGGRFVVGNF
jgi:aminodeoxyfutalosine deaminase